VTSQPAVRRKPSWKQGIAGLPRDAAAVGTAALVSLAILCCATPLAAPRVYGAPPPSSEEQYCAWYGDAREGVLYFGEAPFWSAFRRRDGDPRADLRKPGPQRIGRFDLRRRAFLPSLDLSPASSDAGIWDVLAQPNGRVYFTDFFGSSGYVEPASGRVVRFDALGPGLNELAPGPDGRILVTRYGSQARHDGSVLVIDPEGALVAEYPLHGPEGFAVAPKSVAFDPVRQEIWVNTDLIPLGAGASGGVRHDARLLDRSGTERLRFDAPELQFFRFSADGTGWFAEVDGSLLRLRIRPPERAGSPLLTGRFVPLDDAFAAQVDFVQDIHVAGDRAVVTRWSGRVDVVSRDGHVRSVRLPLDEAGELYYSGVEAGPDVCATRCGGIEVVCAAPSD
jgi:hypothetical protein